MFSDKDIGRVLREWAYDPTKVNVRRIIGEDGREKIQLRLDLGILQMEMTGRPDGKRPFGRESLLDYYKNMLENYRKKHGHLDGFSLSRDDCINLQQESIQYYHRYLSLFHLGDYEGVVRDTERNIMVFDLVAKYAADAADRMVFEQFRPYVVMMNTRARASVVIKKKNFDSAIEIIHQGIAEIERIFVDNEREAQVENSPELAFLRRWMEEVKEMKPLDPVDRLKRELDEAVNEENYELAAKIRDQLNDLDNPTLGGFPL